MSPYEPEVREAQSHPGVWVVLREAQSSANLVTKIRSGRVEGIDPLDFTVRSIKLNLDGKTVYDIELMYKPKPRTESDFTIEDFMSVINDPDVRAAIREALLKRNR